MDDFDEQLLERLKRGDSEAMGALYRRYADRAFGFACRFLHSHEDAEEITGEAFLKVFRFARDFRGEGAFSSWLFRIVRNLCLDRLRQPRLIVLPLEEADASASFTEEVERRERNRTVADALDSLPEEYRSLLILRDIEGLSNREVSEIIGRSEPATKSLHHRARKALRDRLLELWGEPS
ncbi:MAG: RNA polymerase sigma factor [Armatimonadetes bacterium]|nr:RNA polymerase sigma factor [Armatimonadota bacterium]